MIEFFSRLPGEGPADGQYKAPGRCVSETARNSVIIWLADFSDHEYHLKVSC